MTEEYRQPHPKIRPLPEHNAPADCKLACLLDEAFFQNSEGQWIPYYKDGRFVKASFQQE
jgi:hypothetical protein